MREILNSYKQSIERLIEILGQEKTVANRDSTIKRFEFTVELAWKSAQEFLRDQEIICRSPKECLKEIFKFGLIEDNPKWLLMFEDRNLTVHTYDEKTADEVYLRVSDYLPILNQLKDSLNKFNES